MWLHIILVLFILIANLQQASCRGKYILYWNIWLSVRLYEEVSVLSLCPFEIYLRDNAVIQSIIVTYIKNFICMSQIIYLFVDVMDS